MADEFPHLSIDPFFDVKAYTYPKPPGGSGIVLIPRDRVVHANNIIRQLSVIQQQFDLNKAEELPANLVRDDAVYVEFYSEFKFELDFDKFEQETDDSKFKLLNIKKETIVRNDEEQERYKVVVMMREGAVSNFLKKAGEYMVTNTKDRDRNDTGLPSHRALLNNIASIQLATLQSFWTDEPEIAFPNENEILWWEVWFRRTENNEQSLARVLQNVAAAGIQVGQQILEFPEHSIRLLKGSAVQLSSSLILLDNLAELRKPQQLNDFITNRNIDLASKEAWLLDLQERTQTTFNQNSVIIYLLDSGVNNQHPLISPFLPSERLYTYKEAWGTEDTWDDAGGHGTGMAGLAAFGDITEALATPGNIEILHSLLSFKIVHPDDPTDPELYGAVTEYACSTPVTDYPDNPRIYCLSITDKSRAFHGRPSTWSAAIDKITFGRAIDDEPQLMIVSGGNVNYFLAGLDARHFSHHNLLESVHDPAQSYNALTVGSYTRKDGIDQLVWPGHLPLATNGHMSPSNSTSLIWDEHWPIKPDIVMEGGNLSIQGTAISDIVPTLKPLSLDKDFNNYIFNPFGDTIGAAALAAKLAAELKTKYPQYWPETIKGLIVHSAEWTPAMLGNIDLPTATVNQKRSLLRTFGYGVPIKEKVFYSARNILTLIAQNTIQPFKTEGSKVKTNEYHLYKIPWPADVLQNELMDLDVTLKVTLSYFVDPNPGNRRYANHFSYYSHALDFRMIRPTEDIDQFKRRISASKENDVIEYSGIEEPWLLKESVRNKGAIKKDFVVSSGADLATRNMIAVYPKSGWYSSRKKLGLAETKVRYSLIISIETNEINVNIYNPVMQMIENVLTN